jgi:NAD(P)-dependent dehydrogenase (short-subunit alcohol dehydrogenase family)
MSTTSSQRTIVITGCSTGFGRATALHMARSGWRVFATVRKEADQDALRDEATQANCQGLLVPVLCDITSEEQVSSLKKVVSEAVESLDALVSDLLR